MGLRINSIGMVLVLVLWLCEMGEVAKGEDTCISSITPCAEYLNATTKPPTECCGPLLNVINTQQQCLCNLLNSDLFKQSNFNLAQALKLPALCGGKNVTTDACTKGTASSPPPPPSTTRSGSESTNKSSAEAASVEILLPLLAFFFLGVSV